MTRDANRREFLKTTGAVAGLTTIAGCLGGEDSSEDVAQTLRERANQEIEPGERILFAHQFTHNQGEIIGNYVSEDRDDVLEAITRLDNEIEDPESYINGENQDEIIRIDPSNVQSRSLSGANLKRNKFWGDAYLDSTVNYHFIDLTANYNELDDLIIDSMDPISDIQGFTERTITETEPDNEDIELLQRINNGEVQADHQLHSKYAEPNQLSIILTEKDMPSKWNGDETEFRAAYPDITENHEETLQNTLREMGHQFKLPYNFWQEGVMSKHPEAQNSTEYNLHSSMHLSDSVGRNFSPFAILEPVNYPNEEGYSDIAIQLRSTPATIPTGKGSERSLRNFIKHNHPGANFELKDNILQYSGSRNEPNNAKYVSNVHDEGDFSEVIYEFGSIPGLEDELYVKMSYDIDEVEIK